MYEKIVFTLPAKTTVPTKSVWLQTEKKKKLKWKSASSKSDHEFLVKQKNVVPLFFSFFSMVLHSCDNFAFCLLFHNPWIQENKKLHAYLNDFADRDARLRDAWHSLFNYKTIAKKRKKKFQQQQNAEVKKQMTARNFAAWSRALRNTKLRINEMWDKKLPFFRPCFFLFFSGLINFKWHRGQGSRGLQRCYFQNRLQRGCRTVGRKNRNKKRKIFT